LSEASPRQKNLEWYAPPVGFGYEKKEEKESEFAIHTSKASFLVTAMVTVNMINYQYRFGVVGFGNTFGMN